MQPTIITASEFQLAYDHFNTTLFESELPPCLITLQRITNCMGYFSHKRFVSSNGTTDEIAMNPEFFATNPMQETLQTLVHEMVHLWQYHFGTPSRRTYHNAEWANKMEAVGLMPSSTGAPGGARTGQHMADYALPGGLFLVECQALIESKFRISFGDRVARTVSRPTPEQIKPEVSEQTSMLLAAPIQSIQIEPYAKSADRTKFQCASCDLKAWAKPSAKLVCGSCDQPMECA